VLQDFLLQLYQIEELVVHMAVAVDLMLVNNCLVLQEIQE
jgi:hypothetical protein